MASAITSIYSNIASRQVSFDSDIPRVWDLNDVAKFDGETANSCPVRVLNVISPEAGLDEATFVTMQGNQLEATWRISDLLLIRPCAHGGSLRESLPQMINYEVDYLGALSSDRTPTNQSWIESVYMNRGVFHFPTEESDPYYGVEVILTIKEVF